MTLELLVVTIGSLLASFINAAFATGGIYIILATSSFIFPLAIAIPLQSAFAFASLAARIVYFKDHIYWPIVGLFVIGSVFGVAIGSTVFVTLPEATIALLLGLFLLILIWMPRFSQNTGSQNTGSQNTGPQNSGSHITGPQYTSSKSTVSARLPSASTATEHTPLAEKQPLNPVFLPVGVAHSFLGTVFGVGTLLQPTILRTSLTKLQITGTLAACLLCMDVFKLTGYIAHGFDYRDYWPHIICATIAGFAGTVAGKRVTHRVSEYTFRLVFKWLITLVAIRLIYRGVVLW